LALPTVRRERAPHGVVDIPRRRDSGLPVMVRTCKTAGDGKKAAIGTAVFLFPKAAARRASPGQVHFS